MSQPESTELQITTLSRFNAFTVMLFLALVAILLSIALLAIELQRYDWDMDAKTAALGPRVSRVLDVAAPRIG